MGLYRPETFDDVVGHGKLIKIIKDRLSAGNFPQFTLFTGEEGLGKSTLLKLIAMALNCESAFKPCYRCSSCEEIRDQVIRKNQNTAHVMNFKMSEEKSIEVAQQVHESMNTNMLTSGCRVLILEECHRMSKPAQDLLLPDLEYIPKGVYVIAATTDITPLQKTFLSRAVRYNLSRLSMKEMVTLLNREAERRKLTVQGGDTAFELIATWSEFKPRAALKALEAFGDNTKVSLEEIKGFISYLDVKQVSPIISSFGSSPLLGIKAINDLPIDINSYNSLLWILEETLKLALNQHFTKLNPDDAKIISKALEKIDSQLILEFFYEVADMGTFERSKLLAAYLRCHPARTKLTQKDPEIMRQEIQTMCNNAPQDIVEDVHAPTFMSMEEMMAHGEMLVDGEEE